MHPKQIAGFRQAKYDQYINNKNKDYIDYTIL